MWFPLEIADFLTARNKDDLYSTASHHFYKDSLYRRLFSGTGL